MFFNKFTKEKNTQVGLVTGFLLLFWRVSLSAPHSKDELIPLLEEGDVGMVEPLDIRCEGLEVLGLHVEDEDGDIEAVDLLELFFKHGWGLVRTFPRRPKKLL